MRKVLAGCLVVLVIGVIALGAALYFGYRAARPLIEDATAWARQARDLADLSDDVTNTAAYEPPASGELSEDQVRRFLAVHGRVRETLGARWTQLRARATAFEERARAGGRELSFTEIGTMLSEVGNLAIDARRAQVEALNAEGLSSAEYGWVRLRMYEAAGLEMARAVDWSAVEAMVKRGAGDAGVTVPEVRLPDVPARNRELVKPHIEALREWLPLTVLGF